MFAPFSHLFTTFLPAGRVKFLPNFSSVSPRFFRISWIRFPIAVLSTMGNLNEPSSCFISIKISLPSLDNNWVIFTIAFFDNGRLWFKNLFRRDISIPNFLDKSSREKLFVVWYFSKSIKTCCFLWVISLINDSAPRTSLKILSFFLDILRNPFSYFTIVACDIFDNLANFSWVNCLDNLASFKLFPILINSSLLVCMKKAPPYEMLSSYADK